MDWIPIETAEHAAADCHDRNRNGKY